MHWRKSTPTMSNEISGHLRCYVNICFSADFSLLSRTASDIALLSTPRENIGWTGLMRNTMWEQYHYTDTCKDGRLNLKSLLLLCLRNSWLLRWKWCWRCCSSTSLCLCSGLSLTSRYVLYKMVISLFVFAKTVTITQNLNFWTCDDFYFLLFSYFAWRTSLSDCSSFFFVVNNFAPLVEIEKYLSMCPNYFFKGHADSLWQSSNQLCD